MPKSSSTISSKGQVTVPIEIRNRAYEKNRVEFVIEDGCTVALWSQEPLANTIADSLEDFQNDGALVIAVSVYAELHAYPRATRQFIESFITEMDIRVNFEMSREIWQLTADRYSGYCTRRSHSRGG